MNNNTKANKLFKILSLIISVFLIYIFLLNVGIDIKKYQVEIMNKKPFGEIGVNELLIQPIRIEKGDTIESIEVLLATYQRKNNNRNMFYIVNDKGNLLYKKSFSSSNIKDNVYKKFNGLNINCNDETIYLIINSDDAKNGNAITAWINSTPNKSGFNLMKYSKTNEMIVEMEEELIYRVNVKGDKLKYINDKFYPKSQLVTVGIILALILLILLLIKELIKNRGAENEINNSNTML